MLLNISLGVHLQVLIRKFNKSVLTGRNVLSTLFTGNTNNHVGSGGTVFHQYNGRLGNHLFEWASISGIASDNGMDKCMTDSNLLVFFDGIDDNCHATFPLNNAIENGYAKWTKFDLHHTDTVIMGYLQSYKYFDPELRKPGSKKRLQFKPPILNHATVFLQKFRERVLVGIHVRSYEQSHLRTPSQRYYSTAIDYFTERYHSVGFIVICEDPAWCLTQPVFNGSNIHVSDKEQHFAVDMAILSACDHNILSVGTFGWWSAYLGPDSRPGGVVVYYKHEFKENHPHNTGEVQRTDYYPPNWVALGDGDDKLHSVATTKLQTSPDLLLGEATIVTMYYKFPSKHSTEDYVMWMRNMLSLQDAMIIFTTKDMEDMIYQLRDHALNRTLVVVMALEDTAVVQKYGMDFWKDQNLVDPEKYTHTDPRIYIVWNQKPAFVKHAISLNPFKSSHFLWMDIGCLRQTGYNGDWMVTDATPFHNDKVLMLDVTAKTSNFWLDIFFVNENRIGGTIFGGTIAAMLRFSDEYYKTLSVGAELLQFVGKDQLLMFRTCERVHDLCSKIFPNSNLSSDDPWFYMVPFLIHKLWRNE
jgi:galactoside 2-L-fucosyltransferase 1/2